MKIRSLILASLLLTIQACSSEEATTASKTSVPDSFEVVKEYKNSDQEQCKSINITCPEGSKVFFDEKGCGCIGPKEQQLRDENPIGCGGMYAPVCGKLSPECEEEPCETLMQTFGNRCFAERAGATEIKDGACEDKTVDGESVI